MPHKCLGGSLPLALMTAALVTTGCGSGGSHGTTTSTAAPSTPPAGTTRTSTAGTSNIASSTARLTEADLITDANRICGAIATKRNRLGSNSEAEFDLMVPQVAAYQQTMLVDLRKLTPPASLTKRWSEMLEAAQTMSESTQVISQDIHTGHTKPSATSPLFAAFAKARLQLRAISKHVGIAQCATY